MRTQFSDSQRLIKEINEQMNKSLNDVTREQTKANEATREFVTIAEKLGSLEKTLKHQKQRGNWGEASLELILSNTLAPGQYQMQYEFKNGEVVDAVIVTKEGINPHRCQVLARQLRPRGARHGRQASAKNWKRNSRTT
ncbi:MAG: DNA recombination protein RmuC [bacterium]